MSDRTAASGPIVLSGRFLPLGLFGSRGDSRLVRHINVVIIVDIKR